MERTSFIRLLEEYRNKAISEHYRQCKVQASLLITGEYRQAILELEAASATVSSAMERVAVEFKRIAKENMLPDSYGHLYYNTPSTRILDNVIESMSAKIRRLGLSEKKEDEIRNKFDAAIRAAKASRSTSRLKELADALGIETPSIEANTTVSQGVDTEFVKEKIKSVLMLK